MADITVEIVIPEAHQARLKTAIEFAFREGRIQIDGIELREDGTLSPGDTVKAFKRMTLQNWRSFIIRMERRMTEYDPGDIFDPNTVP